MRVRDAISIVDLERLAQRRLPRILFECIQSGVEDEHGVARNAAGFQQHQLLPRHLVDVREREQSTTIFGKTCACSHPRDTTGLTACRSRHHTITFQQKTRWPTTSSSTPHTSSCRCEPA
jgi:isopentenyl diphosphate isomerase/L-lactate dehydrogenase-like FMN-dependent dehydrogenase